MNTDIANYIKSHIEDLDFIGVIAGLVRTVTFDQPDGERNVLKRIPVECKTTFTQCQQSKHQSLVPDSKQKSIIYFEDGGLKPIGSNEWESSLRLVCWMNIKKLGKNTCSESSNIMQQIIKNLPGGFGIYNPFTRIKVNISQIPPKDASIFSKYTYSENIMQYLLYPYDYFAIDFKVRFILEKSCIQNYSVGQEVEC